MASSDKAPPEGEDEPRRYQIEYAEAAQEEIEKAYLWRSSITSPEAAARWASGLRSAVDGLSTMPYRYAALPDDPLSRRLLYGSGQGAYRIIYRVVEPAEEGDNSLVRILHVYHGARQTNQNPNV